jgi:chromosome segregation ATPase
MSTLTNIAAALEAIANAQVSASQDAVELARMGTELADAEVRVADRDEVIRQQMATITAQGVQIDALTAQAEQDRITIQILDETVARLEARIAELEQLLDAEKATLAGKRQTAAVAAAAPRQASGSAQIIRTWAAANGVECPARGPVPQRVVDAYQAATESGAA